MCGANKIIRGRSHEAARGKKEDEGGDKKGAR